ncbi:MAG: SDR family oxidoreductase [Gammaproteobacteria bacterium]|nr:SDR family oxidoreductase [Gammaproteobacteria bacterium]
MTTTRTIIKILALITLSFTFVSNAAAEQEVKGAILVTGASTGLGQKMTEVLSSNGFHVFATARNKTDLDRLDAMNNVQAIELDVRDQQQINDAVKFVKDSGMGLYGLVNNAGVAVFGPMIEIPVEQLEYQLDINVLGPYRVLQAFAPMIIESKGRITTTGSIAGTIASPIYGQYAMSKHAIEAFTDSLAAEMQRFDVKVSVIAPGSFASQIGNTAKKRIENSSYWSEETLYPDERKGTLIGLSKVTEGADPLPVAEAVLDFMQSDNPKKRYMVVPNERQAQATLRNHMKRLLEQNQSQNFSYNAEQLQDIFNEEIEKLSNNPAKKLEDE